jgi:uncharacterized protein DUF2845
MRTRFLATLLTLGIAVPLLAHADGLRCGSRLVSTGDTRASVRHKCGEPLDVTHKTLVRRPSYVFHRHVYYGDEVAVDVESWTYNFGPNKFMRRVRFVDGIVEDVETLDYGYNEDQPK